MIHATRIAYLVSFVLDYIKSTALRRATTRRSPPTFASCTMNENYYGFKYLCHYFENIVRRRATLITYIQNNIRATIAVTDRPSPHRRYYEVSVNKHASFLTRVMAFIIFSCLLRYSFRALRSVSNRKVNVSSRSRLPSSLYVSFHDRSAIFQAN